MIVTGTERTTQIAVCLADACAWTARGGSRDILNAVDEHVEGTHHRVELRVDRRVTISWKDDA